MLLLPLPLLLQLQLLLLLAAHTTHAKASYAAANHDATIHDRAVHTPADDDVVNEKCTFEAGNAANQLNLTVQRIWRYNACLQLLI